MADAACGENAPHRYLAELRRGGYFLAIGGVAEGAMDALRIVYHLSIRTR